MVGAPGGRGNGVKGEAMIDHATLKAKQRALREGFPETMGLKVHRALSWVGRAETEEDDPDARFLFLWIAFNALYADMDLSGEEERARFRHHFNQLVSLDHDRRIYDAVWQRFAGPIRLFMQSPYVFSPFWQFVHGLPGGEDWQERFSAATRAFKHAVENGDTAAILSMLFDRLYVLRNQLFHGGATWNSSVNRDQMRDGAEILGCLVPLFIDIMMDHPEADWGRPHYPVVTDRMLAAHPPVDEMKG